VNESAPNNARMKTLLKFLEESDGVLSSIRLQMLLCTFFCAILPITVWGILSVWKGALLEFPVGLSTFLIAIMGAATAGKVTQYWKE
jgi:hypothetical protein